MTGQASWLDQARGAHRCGDDIAKLAAVGAAVHSLSAAATGPLPADRTARLAGPSCDNPLLDKAGRNAAWLLQDGEIAESMAIPLAPSRLYADERGQLTRIFSAIDTYSEQ